MPIYEYRCSNCGHELEALQKISDPVLSDCPSCSTPSLTKLVSAAGFQLKGNGWYATDFRSGANKAAKSDASKPADGAGAAASESKSDGKSEAASAPSAGGCGSNCACH